jgi:hypothetical protein
MEDNRAEGQFQRHPGELLIDDARLRFETEARKCDQADTQAIALAAIAGTLGLLVATAHGKGRAVTILVAVALLLVMLSIVYALLVRIPGFLLPGMQRAIARLTAAIADSNESVRESRTQHDPDHIVTQLLCCWDARIALAVYLSEVKEIDLKWSLFSLLGAAIAGTLSVIA